MKSKNIKLGKIKDGKLVGFDLRACWNLDNTLAIIIRDLLRTLAGKTHGYPAGLDNNGIIQTVVAYENPNNQKYDIWVDKLNKLADKFDVYAHKYSGDKEREANQIGKEAVLELTEVFTNLWD